MVRVGGGSGEEGRGERGGDQWRPGGVLTGSPPTWGQHYRESEGGRGEGEEGEGREREGREEGKGRERGGRGEGEEGEGREREGRGGKGYLT